jgi:hypothetical protein
MADKKSRDGGSGLGWFIIGLLIGVAGTLATQKFAVFKNIEASPDATTASLQPAAGPAPPGAPPKLIVHQGDLYGASALSAAPGGDEPLAVPAGTDETPADVADDAAATGMTARAHPKQPPAN